MCSGQLPESGHLQKNVKEFDKIKYKMIHRKTKKDNDTPNECDKRAMMFGIELQ